MVAPIALYSDQLLATFLMAATYPDEVQEAARWTADPANASLHGEALTAALDAMDWGPGASRRSRSSPACCR